MWEANNLGCNSFLRAALNGVSGSLSSQGGVQLFPECNNNTPNGELDQSVVMEKGKLSEEG